MINEKMVKLGTKRSIIREIFEYGKKRKAEIGEENVFDFTLGNPSIPAPKEINEAVIRNLSRKDAHGYTSAVGDNKFREAIANDLNKRFNTNFKFNNFFITYGAASALCSTLRALLNKNEEVITFAPFFTEYTVFTEAQGGKLVVVPADKKSFQINFNAFVKKINKKTKAVIINSPNNPSGVVYSEETIIKLTNILKDKEKEFGHEIYLISDEPYREIAYGVTVPFVTKYYHNAIVCYSYSKSLSLPGERIGYVLVPDEVTDSKNVYAAVAGAARALGHVCAPSLMQFAIADCANLTSDLKAYEENRNLIYKGLKKLGYKCVKPDGAFYLFVKALEKDAYEFYKKALKYDILVVPSDDFGVKGYVRIAYCVSKETIINSLPKFELLMKEYKK